MLRRLGTSFSTSVGTTPTPRRLCWYSDIRPFLTTKHSSASRASVFHGRLCLPIAPHHDVAVAACFVLLCFLGVASGSVELQSFNPFCECFEVGVDDEGGWELFVVVHKRQPVLALLGHLYSDCSLANTLALWLVGPQQVFPGVAMKALFAEMFTLVVLTFLKQQTVEILDPSVVKLACLFNQQEVDPGHVHMLLTELVNSHALVPSKDIDGQIVLPFNFRDLRDRGWGVNP